MGFKEEIKEYREYLVNKRNSQRVTEQQKDLEYFKDTFKVPHVKKPEYILRNGFGASMVNGITQQLVADLPRLYAKPRKQTDDVKTSANKIAAKGNQWLYDLSRQSINPFKRSFKDLMVGGDTWLYVPHKAELAMWKGKIAWQEEMPDDIPCHIIRYDPMVVFHDPSEEVDGEPTRVVVFFKRSVADILADHPNWTKGVGRKSEEQVDYTLLVDGKMIYAEADEEPLFRDKGKNLSKGDGRRNNIYGGILPFVHCYSGWGYETADKSPELLAYSRLRMIRGKLQQKATMDSNFNYNLTALAWKHRLLLNQSGQEISADAFKEYYPNDPGKLSVLTLPTGAGIDVEETQAFDAPAFAYLDRVNADIAMEYPSPLRGMASGTSGRQEDILSGLGMAMYDGALTNVGNLWAKAFDKIFKISNAIPDMLPAGISKKDIESYSQLHVDLSEGSPLNKLRTAADGDRKYQLGIIDLETNLIQYQGYTQEEAEQTMINLLKDDATRNNPMIKMIMGMMAAQESGMLEQIQQFAQMGLLGNTGMNPPVNFGSQGGAPREGNIQSPMGAEMMDMSQERRTPRRSPVSA